MLRNGVALLGREAHPAHRLDGIPRNAPPRGVHHSEPALRLGEPLVGRQAQPTHSLGVVLPDAATFGVQQPEAALRQGMSLLGRQAIPADRLGSVPRNAATLGGHRSDIELRLRVPLSGGRSEGFQILHRGARAETDEQPADNRQRHAPAGRDDGPQQPGRAGAPGVDARIRGHGALEGNTSV